jgi:hypothetical protein
MNKYVKGITQFIQADHFGTMDFIDYQCESLGLSRDEYMAYYGIKESAIIARTLDESKNIKISVWTDRRKSKKTIDLDSRQLQKAVSSGHDNDFDWNINQIKQQIDRGDKEGTTDIQRYYGGGTDTVYWELNESVNEEEKKQSTDKGPIDDEKIETALKTKAKETGVPIGIIRAVMRRGMAAWKTGHRPGANQQQWGYARVNSFLTKGDGTWGKADKDLAKEVRDAGKDGKLKKG